MMIAIPAKLLGMTMAMMIPGGNPVASEGALAVGAAADGTLAFVGAATKGTLAFAGGATGTGLIGAAAG